MIHFYLLYWILLYFLRSRAGTTVIMNQRNVLLYMISYCHLTYAAFKACALTFVSCQQDCYNYCGARIYPPMLVGPYSYLPNMYLAVGMHMQTRHVDNTV